MERADETVISPALVVCPEPREMSREGLCAAVANPINKLGSLTSCRRQRACRWGRMTISLKLGFPGFVKSDNSDVLQLCLGICVFPSFYSGLFKGMKKETLNIYFS